MGVTTNISFQIYIKVARIVNLVDNSSRFINIAGPSIVILLSPQSVPNLVGEGRNNEKASPERLAFRVYDFKLFPPAPE